MAIRRREYNSLKQNEIRENCSIEKNIRLVQKKRSVAKQEQNKVQLDHMKQQRRQILEMRLQQDLERQKMLSDLHSQVRYIKNNYLN